MRNEIEIKLVDANSQFTRSLTDVSDPFAAQDATLKKMASDEVLRCGHYIYGNRHNLVGLVIGRSNAESLKAIGKDFRDKLQGILGAHFGPEGPVALKEAILLFPIDSSALSILGMLGDVVPPRDRLFGLARTFHVGSRYELRFEPEIAPTITVSSGREKLLVIFFDDSRSSGETERRAVEALSAQYTRERVKQKDKGQIVVFSYAVVNRTRPRSALSDDMELQLRGECKVSILRSQYCFLPLESTDENNCRLCVAERRFHIGLAGLGEGYFDLVGRSTQPVADFLRRKHADVSEVHPKSAEFIQLLTFHMLQLCQKELPSICYQLGKQRYSAEKISSLTVFLAASYRDARAYMSEDQMIGLLLQLLENVADQVDADYSFFSHLLAVTLLPVDIATRLFEQPKFYSVAPKVPPTKMASLILIILRNHQYALGNTLAAVDLATAVKITDKRQTGLIGRILDRLEPMEREARAAADEGADRLANIQNLKATVLALGGLSGERTPIKLARLIGIRMFNGTHSSYVKQILTSEDDRVGLEGPQVGLQVLTTMRDFARIVSSPYETEIGDDINGAEERARKIIVDTPPKERHVAVRSLNQHLFERLNYYWHRTAILKAHFHSIESVIGLLEETKNDLKVTAPFLNSVITDKLNRLIRVRSWCKEPREWKVLGPTGVALKDLFNNLLTNPFVHYSDEIEAADEAGRIRLFDQLAEKGPRIRGPLIDMMLSVDLDTQRLFIVCCDHAKQARVENIELGRNGLGNSQVWLAAVDGTLEYLPGAGVPGASQSKRQKWILETMATDIRHYGNVFIVSLPLIYKG